MRRYRSMGAGATILTLMLVLAAPAAADPIIGSWKLNPAKSKCAQNSLSAREQLEVYREMSSGEIELTYKSTERDGSSRLLVFVWPAQGGVAKVQQGDPKGQTWVETVVKPGEWYMTALREDKQVAIRHKVVSKDGRTMRHTVRSVDAQGKPYEDLLVFERQ